MWRGAIARCRLRFSPGEAGPFPTHCVGEGKFDRRTSLFPPPWPQSKQLQEKPAPPPQRPSTPQFAPPGRSRFSCRPSRAWPEYKRPRSSRIICSRFRNIFLISSRLKLQPTPRQPSKFQPAPRQPSKFLPPPRQPSKFQPPLRQPSNSNRPYVSHPPYQEPPVSRLHILYRHASRAKGAPFYRAGHMTPTARLPPAGRRTHAVALYYFEQTPISLSSPWSPSQWAPAH